MRIIICILFATILLLTVFGCSLNNADLPEDNFTEVLASPDDSLSPVIPEFSPPPSAPETSPPFLQSADDYELPSLTGIPIKDAHALADAFVEALNSGRDLTGAEHAIDSWLALFDFDQMPVHNRGVYEVQYSENLYQFDVMGKAHNGDTASATVLVNLQNEEPFYFCDYTYYYPYALPVVTEYIELLANGDVKQLAVWLAVDGGPEPGDDFMQRAELGLSEYSAYDLQSALVTGISYDNDAQRFICTVEDTAGELFEIQLSYGDGLIRPD